MATGPATSPATPRSRAADLLLLAGFAAALLVPSLGWLVGRQGPAAFEELRPLAPAPDWGGASLAEVARQAERYIDDHFGFRGDLVVARNRLLAGVLGESPVPEVLFGSDGWLFYGGDRMTESFRRALPPLERGLLRAWTRVLTERAEWLASRGGCYRFVIAPEKCTVYPEYMPMRLAPLPGVLRIEQLSEHLARAPATGLVNLLPALVGGKSQGLVYRPTDTHWTPLGTALAYREIVLSLAAAGACGPPRALGDLLGTASVEHAGGDLARYCSLEPRFVELFPELRPLPPLAAQRLPRASGQAPHEAHFVRAAAASPRVAVLLGDSFGELVLDLLADQFAELHAYPTHEFPAAAILATGATVVVSEMAERRAIGWLPHNPVPVRRVPGPTELAELRTVGTRIGALEVVGHRLAEVDGEGELVIAWRATAATRLSGVLELTLRDRAGRHAYSATWPQDPVGSTVAAGTLWVDRVPLPAGIAAVGYRLRGEPDAPELRCELR